MAIGEFQLIERYFRSDPATAGLILGIGDDAAILDGSNELTFAVVRWRAATPDGADRPAEPAGSDGASVAHALISALLTDLPADSTLRYLLLGLTLDEDDPAWLDAFSSTLADRAARLGATLAGGDTTRGPRTVVLYGLGVRQ